MSMPNVTNMGVGGVVASINTQLVPIPAEVAETVIRLLGILVTAVVGYYLAIAADPSILIPNIPSPSGAITLQGRSQPIPRQTSGITLAGVGATVAHMANATAARLGRIASRYKLGQCEATAAAIASDLAAEGLDFQYVEIYWTGDGRGRNNVVSDIMDGGRHPISESGYHIGVLFGGNVYCNVHPTGQPLNVWLNDFWGVGEMIYYISRSPIGARGMQERSRR